MRRRRIRREASMFDPKEYCEVCRELRAPEKKIEEIIAMTEHRTPKKWVRSLGAGLTACAAAATMVVGVAAANPEAAQEFFAHITSAVKVDEFRRDLTTKDGEQVTVLDLPQATVGKPKWARHPGGERGGDGHHRPAEGCGQLHPRVILRRDPGDGHGGGQRHRVDADHSL